jgi:hypothetical protein
MQRTSAKGHVTSMGGLQILRMAWDTLDMDSILVQNAFETPSGVRATNLAFSVVVRLFVQTRSSVQLEKAPSDPMFETLVNIDYIDESTVSRFFSDSRF